MFALAAQVIEARLNADTSDHAGPWQPCPCGAEARYAGRRPKTFSSTLGPLTLSRAYYHCEACQGGFCPRDRALGLDASGMTPAVLRMVGHVGACVSFDEGQRLLAELAGVQMPTKQVERAAEALGAEIAEDERRDVDGPDPSEPVASTLYLGMDGSGVPMRSTELEGRAGKQPDGSSKTRELKLVTTWTAETCDADGVPVRDAGSVAYSAAIESAASKDTDALRSDFALRAEREAQRRGFDRAARRVVLGDGAPWIWKIADESFPDATQIVDRFHVKQHLSEVGKAIFGAGSESAQTWAQARNDELDAGKLDEIIAALTVHADTCDEARKCVGYIDDNRQRMRYPEFRAQGLCTSSGVVEAGCKNVAGVRLKRAGMHWTVRGANAIAALRCCRLSGRFESFRERRAERRQAA